MRKSKKFIYGIKRGMEVLIPGERIAVRVSKLAAEISLDYKGKRPVLAASLAGSFMFLADLVRELDPNLLPNIDFMDISSYGGGHESSGEPIIKKDLEIDITGRDVLIIEDIIDTGHTLQAILERLQGKNPASLKTCVLLSKMERREVDVPVEYIGFEIPNRYVIGYGLDDNEDFRHLADIWVVPE